MSRIYLASRYSRIDYMRRVRDILEREDGHQVVSRWIEGNHECPACNGGDIASRCQCNRFAAEDYTDLQSAETVLSFTEPPRSTNGRGGRHVEFGMAVALGLRCLIVGPIENVFHHLPGVEVCRDLDSARFAMRPKSLVSPVFKDADQEAR